MDKKYFLFFLLFWIAQRLYFFAPSYIESKIFHSIGLHIEIITILCCNFLTQKDEKLKLFWKYLLIYSVICCCFYVYVQFTCNHLSRANLWGYYNLPATLLISKNLSILEVLFVPVYALFVWMKIEKPLNGWMTKMTEKLKLIIQKDLWKVFIAIMTILATSILGIGLGQVVELSNNVTISLERNNALYQAHHDYKDNTDRKISKLQEDQHTQTINVKELTFTTEELKKRTSKIEKKVGI